MIWSPAALVAALWNPGGVVSLLATTTGKSVPLALNAEPPLVPVLPMSLTDAVMVALPVKPAVGVNFKKPAVAIQALRSANVPWKVYNLLTSGEPATKVTPAPRVAVKVLPMVLLPSATLKLTRTALVPASLSVTLKPVGKE